VVGGEEGSSDVVGVGLMLPLLVILLYFRNAHYLLTMGRVKCRRILYLG
jgi:hypothetical protein